MKLSELYKKTLEEVLETMELSGVKIHADDTEEIQRIELKYKAKETESSMAGESKTATGF